MKKRITLFATVLVLAAGFGISSINVSEARMAPYKQGKFVEDSNCVKVYVCPHSDGDSNCV